MTAFEKQYKGPKNREIMVKRLLRNQTVRQASGGEDTHSFETDEGVRLYLERNSNYIRPVAMKELARGGEAVVYRIEHTGLDEVVAKCSLSRNSDTFTDIMQETHTLKVLQNQDYICEIKEEIIEYDFSTHRIRDYCVLVEQA